MRDRADYKPLTVKPRRDYITYILIYGDQLAEVVGSSLPSLCMWTIRSSLGVTLSNCWEVG